MSEWALNVKSTVDERFGQELPVRVATVLHDAGVEVTGFFGGTAFGDFDTDPYQCDNGWTFIADEVTARRIEREVAKVTERPTILWSDDE